MKTEMFNDDFQNKFIKYLFFLLFFIYIYIYIWKKIMVSNPTICEEKLTSNPNRK